MRTKKFITFFLLTLSLFMLAGCSKIGSIKRDFEKAGYTYNEEATDEYKSLVEDLEDEDLKITVHVFNKVDRLKSSVAVVLEFESSKELNKQIDENENFKELLDDAKQSDYIRGNCFLIPISLDPQGVIDAFQGRK